MTSAVVDERIMVDSADSTPIALWRRGVGPPVVFIHGTGEDHHRWRPIVGRLAHDFTVYCVDRRGRGLSGDGDGYRLGAEADDIIAVVTRLGGAVTLVAHSYGAICAIEAAIELPHLTGLVLYEPPVPVASTVDRRPVAHRIQSAVDAGDLAEGLCLFLSDVIGMPRGHVDMIRRIPGFADRAGVATTIAREIEATAHYVLDRERLRALRAPLLLLSGEVSPRDLGDAVNEVAAVVPHGEVTVLAGQAHQAMDTDPAGFLAVLRDFLARIERTST